MSGSGNYQIDLARIAYNGETVASAVERAVEFQNSKTYEAALGFARNDLLQQAIAGCSTSEIAKLADAARCGLYELQRQLEGRSALHSMIERLNNPLTQLYSDRSAVSDLISRINSFDATSYGVAYAAAFKLAAMQNFLVQNSIDASLRKTIEKLTVSPLASFTASQRAALGFDDRTVGALSRSLHWAETLSASKSLDYTSLLGSNEALRSQIDTVQLAAKDIIQTVASYTHSDAASQVRDLMVRHDLKGMAATATKMSLFAGGLDIFGPDSLGSAAAFSSLLGGYNTSLMPLRGYWRDRGERARYYRDHEVDEGLVDAENAATIEALIDSGVVEGRLTRGGRMTALVEVGSVRLRIHASRPKAGAFAAIDMFENELRRFVACKLEPVLGPKWFTQRAPGDAVLRAKERRHEAMRAGEASLPLINYTDLGDLLGFMIRTDNWTEFFESVFDKREHLKVDLERINANRRPTMHSRPVDPVQLTEIILTITRLRSWMERDGKWSAGWDDDV